MKFTRRSKSLSAVAALLALCMVLPACSPSGKHSPEPSVTVHETKTPESPLPSDTAAPPVQETEPESTVPPRPEDTPKTDTYSTTSDLVIPNYTYDVDSQDNNGILPTSRDVLADTWTGTDGADRALPLSDATRAPTDRQVGIFYFLWRDRDQNSLSEISPSDHYAAYLAGGVDQLWEVMKEGGEGHPHYWAEPYFGYYSSNDEWVLRRHAYMLAEAGVDFVFFDTSNNNLHTVSHMALLKVWEEVRQEGYDVPKICFLVGSYDAEFAELYESIYKKGLYEDLWFYWDGKPLVMLTGNINMSEEAKNFFTIRYSWAVGNTSWYENRRGAACWPWSCIYPQKSGFAEDGETLEQIVVMCGMGASVGRSYRAHTKPRYRGEWLFGFPLMEEYTPFGITFGMQFDMAMEVDAPVMMITGWNEWVTGRWSGAGAGAGGVGLYIAGQYYVSNDPNAKESNYFVDSFNPEYSRDIEPMKGGFGDNYLYQMAERVREYKGSRALEAAFGQWAIDINGSQGQWYAVGPEFYDYEGDVTHRVSPGHVGGKEYGMYVNFSGRNDLVTAKVSNDTDHLYFYVECADDITAPAGANWMNLFINADTSDETGWYGFDYILNRNRDDGRVLVERFTGKDSWTFETVGTADYTVSGNVMQIRISKSLLGLASGQSVTIDFKWADNSVPTGDIMEFLDQGDAAPNGRYTYRFTTEAQAEKLPTELSISLDNIVVLKANSYHAFVGGHEVRLANDNTRAVTFASDTDIWLPVSFLESALGIQAAGETYDHYGVSYVKATDLIRAAGKVITVTADGLVVIGNEAVTNEEDLRVLYRALH